MARRVVILLCAVSIVATSGCARRTAMTRSEAPVPSGSGSVPGPPVATQGDRGVERRDDAIALEPAFFDFDSWRLSADARAALERSASHLRRDGTSVVVEGHCDERGSIEYNLALGERRAQSARDFLVEAGVPADKLEIVSYGKERPFAPGGDETAWRLNRRAHLTPR